MPPIHESIQMNAYFWTYAFMTYGFDGINSRKDCICLTMCMLMRNVCMLVQHVCMLASRVPSNVLLETCLRDAMWLR